MHCVGILSVLLLYLLVSQPGQAAESSPTNPQKYLESLIKRAKESRLADQRTWQLLLHYRPDEYGPGVTSEVDNDDFFRAANGKTNPEAELTATLVAFFSTKKLRAEKLLPQCAFPARYHWLNAQLQFDPALMRIQRCGSIDLWRERISASSVSLIFSSYYLNNPASMFGHTLLRFNSAKDAKPNLLDFSVNYAAVIDPESGLFDYAWQGITGGFEGRFSVIPYYDMVKRYNNQENRDMWEYRLNFSKAQIDFMLLHIWELTFANFDFFFMHENCSYHLLSVLEVGNPELHLRDKYWGWTLPTDTIKQINDQPGLVGGIIHRPSLGSQLSYRFADMNARETSFVKRLSNNSAQVDIAEFDQLTPKRRALVIDAAINLIQYNSYESKEYTDSNNNKMYALLVQRSQIPVVNTEPPQPDTPPASPDQGHDPVRFKISAGSFHSADGTTEIDSESFVDLSIQPGFHDLLSNEAGQAPNSQINFLNLQIRYEEESESWQVQNFSLIDIISLYPISTLIQKPSWKINLGWQRIQDTGCLDCTPLIFNPGVGLAFQSNYHRREIYFAFLEADLEFDSDFDSGHRAGFGATAGILFDLSEKWRLALVANRTHFKEGQRDYVSETELRQRFTLSLNSELTLDFFTVKDYREGNVGFVYYF